MVTDTDIWWDKVRMMASFIKYSEGPTTPNQMAKVVKDDGDNALLIHVQSIRAYDKPGTSYRHADKCGPSVTHRASVQGF